MAKVKIVLDTNIIIHFSNGECLSILPKIFDNYDYILLDGAFDELPKNIQDQVDRQIAYFKNIERVQFPLTNPTLMKEFATLVKTLGKGEAISMMYCNVNKSILASSDLKDIKAYCNFHKIIYIATLDFIYHASIIKKIMSIKEANEFLQKVKDEGSKLPPKIVDINTYTPLPPYQSLF